MTYTSATNKILGAKEHIPELATISMVKNVSWQIIHRTFKQLDL